MGHKVVGKTRKRDKFKKFIMGDRANKDDGNHDDDDEDEDDPYGLAENSRERLPLPLLLKRAELAVVDLKVLVKHSGLPEMSKDLLVEQLEAFHTGAKTTGRQIQFLQARAHGCLDGLVIRNTYLIMELDRLEKKQLLLETNRDNAGIWDKMLDTLLMSNGNFFLPEVQLVVSEKKLNQLYQKTMAEARNHLRDLIFKAQEIVIQESSQQNRKHEDTLAQIWTIFGINRLEIEYYRENLALLRELEGQRKAAVGQIQSAVWKLTDFEAEFGILREKIVDGIVSSSEDGGPPVIEGPNESKSGLGEVATMPLKVHIQQIELVTNRLKDRSFLSNTKAKDKVKDPKEDNPEPSAAA
ncbi:hypothetical protein BGZ46_008667 [Entomortierella lignicola]|nr:hypothetical protein BGZ46_008667 [Entomortierella lignicola]